MRARERRKTTKTVCPTRVKSSSYHCPLEECAGEKNNFGDRKHRGDVWWKVGDGKSKHGSQKNPYDYNSPCENCPCDL